MGSKNLATFKRGLTAQIRVNLARDRNNNRFFLTELGVGAYQGTVGGAYSEQSLQALVHVTEITTNKKSGAGSSGTTAVDHHVDRWQEKKRD